MTTLVRSPLLQGTMVYIIEGKYKGEEAVITRFIGDVFPYMYELELMDGKPIVLLGNEIERA